MTNDLGTREPRGGGPDTPGDPEVGDLVRGVVAGWTMPPGRLEATTWRERIGPRGLTARQRSGWAGRWLRRLGIAASAAVLAALGLALIAVWLGSIRPASVGIVPSHPPTATPGGSASPTNAPPSPSAATQAPVETALPTFALYGPALTGTIVAGIGQGYRTIDLATGKAGDLLLGTSYASQLFRLPAGGLICACQTWDSTDFISGTLTIDARFVASDGTTSRRIPIEALTAGADPNAGQNDSQGAIATAGLTADGRTMYVAWGYRKSPTWHLGIDVVDLAAGKVVQTVRLADRPALISGSPIGPWLPWINVAPDGSAAMLTIQGLDGAAGTTHVLAALSGGRITGTTTLPATTSTIEGNACTVWSSEGWATNDSYFSVCSSPAAVVVFDRGGHVLSTQIFAQNGQAIEPSFTGPDAVDRRAGFLYHWDPFGRTLTRVDLATGKIDGTVTATPTSAGDGGAFGVLGDLGRRIARWIAPQGTAKTFLQPGLAIAPDGSRAYAIGVSGSGGGAAASSGVEVFDLRTMTQVGRWDPLADLISIAVSPDGRYVYVAGGPTNDPTYGAAYIPASLEVYDAATGNVRLIVGDLGTTYLALLP